MSVRVVVADQGEARFYDLRLPTAELTFAGTLEDPSAHGQDRDFSSDKPERVASPADGAIRSAAKQGTDVFAGYLIETLQRAHAQGAFQKLVLIAPAAFLSKLRKGMPKPLAGSVLEEIHKDLVHQPASIVHEHLTSKTLGSTVFKNAS